MNVRELTDLLAGKAKKLGVSEPSERVVSSWIEKGIIPGSLPVGGGGRGKPPVWTLPDSSVTGALRIIDFKQFGAKRANEFIVLLWLDGYDYSKTKIQNALANEIDRVSARHFPDGYPAWVVKGFKAKEPKVSDRQNRQLGDQDARLAAFRPSDADALKLTSFGLSGYPGEMNEGQMMSELIAQLFPQIIGIESPLPPSMGLAGILAKPIDSQSLSQNSEEIVAASAAQLNYARSAFQLIKSIFEQPETLSEMIGIQLTEEQSKALAAAAYSLNATAWAVYMFVLILRFIRSGVFDGSVESWP